MQECNLGKRPDTYQKQLRALASTVAEKAALLWSGWAAKERVFAIIRGIFEGLLLGTPPFCSGHRGAAPREGGSRLHVLQMQGSKTSVLGRSGQGPIPPHGWPRFARFSGLRCCVEATADAI